jgi:hypothetical protein
VSLTPVANLPVISTSLAKLVAKFAARFVDASGCACEYLRKFSKKLSVMGYSGAGDKLIHEKNQKQKIS